MANKKGTAKSETTNTKKKATAAATKAKTQAQTPRKSTPAKATPAKANPVEKKRKDKDKDEKDEGSAQKKQKVPTPMKKEDANMYHMTMPAEGHTPTELITPNETPSPRQKASMPGPLSPSQPMHGHQMHDQQQPGHQANCAISPGAPQKLSLPVQLLNVVMHKDPSLLPDHAVTSGVLNSAQIDKITYAMWDLAIQSNNNKGDALWDASGTSALFPEPVLRGLAILNWLPSWWYLRGQAVQAMTRSGKWSVDDNATQALFDMACEQGKRNKDMFEQQKQAVRSTEQGPQ